MEKGKVSVIVPIYNAEKTLRRCVDSIMEQSFKDFELILVDDGSKDQSASTCEEYAAKHTFIKAIHKENGGVSSARNCGLRAAEGKYIVFVDADDTVGPHYLKTLMDAADELDICIGSMTLIYDGERSATPHFADMVCRNHDDMARAMLCLNRQDIPISACNCLLRKDIIAEHGVWFDEEIRVCEDEDFILRYLPHAENLHLVNAANYTYYVPADTKTYNSKNGLYTSLKLIEDIYALTAKESIRKQFRQKYLDWCTEELFYYEGDRAIEPLVQKFGRLCQPYLSESTRPSFRHRAFKLLCVSQNPRYIHFLSRAIMSLYNTLKK